MSDSLLSVVFIFAELGAVLLLLSIVLVMRSVSGSKKEVRTTQGLIKYIKSIIPKHREQLNKYFKDKVEKDKIDFNVETLIKDEKKIYDRIIKVSITKNVDLLRLTTEDINSLINNYVRLLALEAESDSTNEKDSKAVILQKENEALRIENASLKTRLDTLNETIESMMGEFSSMYEGGKKEGEQRLKNEMYQLKQSLKEEEDKTNTELKELDESSGT